MSEEVDAILKEWGLHELTQKFRENCVDITILCQLTPDLIRELIPEVGLRLKFIEQWTTKRKTLKQQAPMISTQHLLNEIDNTIDNIENTGVESDSHELSANQPVDIEEPTRVLSELNVPHEEHPGLLSTDEESDTYNDGKKRRLKNNAKLKGIKKQRISSSSDSSISTKQQTSDDESSVDEQIVVAKKKTQKQRDLRAQNESITPEATTSSGSSGTTNKENETSFCTKLHPGGKRKNFIGEEEFKIRLAEESTLSVKNLLSKNSAGKLLLNSLIKKKRLTKEDRRKLTQILVSELITDENTFLRNDHFDKLSDEIVALFPSEEKAVYYIPPIAKSISRSKKSESARGKLVNRYRNQIKQYRRRKGDNKKSELPTQTNATDKPTNSIHWLKNNRGPFEDVKKHWKKTTKYRYNELEVKKTSIRDYVEQWNVLKDSQGYVLIELDFRQFLKNSETLLYQRWNQFFEKIKLLRRLTNVNAKSLLEILDDDAQSDNCKILAQVLLLSFFVPPKAIIKNNKKHWKPSITECQESMVVHVKIPGDIDKARQEKRDKMFGYGLTVQPYIIVVGPTLQEISDYYVVIDEIHYKVDSPLKALDVCFKSFHVFTAQYPAESEHIYLLIQLAIYKFTTKWDKALSHVSEILNDIA